MILKQGHKYHAMPHDGKTIWRIYRGGRCYYKDSPYSPEATQALKAAFPQYWTAIRDYGVAHPQLVPFINEDPMLICSLVEVGKTRWLVGDGKAYIDTGIAPKATTGIKTKIRHKQSIYNSFIFSAGGLEDRYAMYEQNNVAIIWYVPNSYTSTSVKLDKTLVVEYNINNTVRIFDEQSSLLYSRALAQKDCTAPLRTGSSLSQYPTGVDDYSYIIMEDNGDCLQNLVPCQHQGQCGMLDILSGNFHPNANTEGTFTIQVTDKAT